MAGDVSGGKVVATMGIVAALLGVLAAAITLENQRERGASQSQDTESTRVVSSQPPSRSENNHEAGIVTQLKKDQRTQSGGSCYLPGEWELTVPSGNAGPRTLPVRFSNNSLVFWYGEEIRTSCVVKSDSIEVTFPTVDFAALSGSSQIGGFMMAMPTHYERESENTYVGTALVGKCYLRRR